MSQGHLVIWACSTTAMNDILPEASGLGKPDYLLIVWLWYFVALSSFTKGASAKTFEVFISCCSFDIFTKPALAAPSFPPPWKPLENDQQQQLTRWTPLLQDLPHLDDSSDGRHYLQLRKVSPLKRIDQDKPSLVPPGLLLLPRLPSQVAAELGRRCELARSCLSPQSRADRGWGWCHRYRIGQRPEWQRSCREWQELGRSWGWRSWWGCWWPHWSGCWWASWISSVPWCRWRPWWGRSTRRRLGQKATIHLILSQTPWSVQLLVGQSLKKKKNGRSNSPEKVQAKSLGREYFSPIIFCYILFLIRRRFLALNCLRWWDAH